MEKLPSEILEKIFSEVRIKSLPVNRDIYTTSNSEFAKRSRYDAAKEDIKKRFGDVFSHSSSHTNSKDADLDAIEKLVNGGEYDYTLVLLTMVRKVELNVFYSIIVDFSLNSKISNFVFLLLTEPFIDVLGSGTILDLSDSFFYGDSKAICRTVNNPRLLEALSANIKNYSTERALSCRANLLFQCIRDAAKNSSTEEPYEISTTCLQSVLFLIDFFKDGNGLKASSLNLTSNKVRSLLHDKCRRKKDLYNLYGGYFGINSFVVYALKSPQRKKKLLEILSAEGAKLFLDNALGASTSTFYSFIEILIQKDELYKPVVDDIAKNNERYIAVIKHGNSENIKVNYLCKLAKLYRKTNTIDFLPFRKCGMKILQSSEKQSSQLYKALKKR